MEPIRVIGTIRQHAFPNIKQKIKKKADTPISTAVRPRSSHVRLFPANNNVPDGTHLWKAVRRNLQTINGAASRPIVHRKTPRFRINPDSKHKHYWDIGIALCVVYAACSVPYRICFQVDASGGYHYLEAVIDYCFVADILLHFLTGVSLPNGDVSYELSYICKVYMRGWFALDLISTLPIEIIARFFGYAGSTKALLSAKLFRGLKVLRLFKLARIRKVGAMLSNLEEAVYTNQSIISIIKIGLNMLFISHLVACLWYYIGTLEKSSGAVAWSDILKYSEHIGHQGVLKYVASVYWAILTMSTIGYGDIISQNNNERLFSIAIMGIGVTLFGFVIGTISSLIANINVTATLYEERMMMVKEYIISRKLPKQMGKRIRDHFEYYYQNHSVYRQARILEKLPTTLRDDLAQHAHYRLISSIKYFDTCNETLLSEAVMFVQPFQVLKDEFVYVQYEIAAHIFFLIKGKVALVRSNPHDKTQIRLGLVSSGGHFGELEVYDEEVGNGVRIGSAIARMYCELAFLSREAITKLSVKWPDLAMHFAQAAKELSLTYRRRADEAVWDTNWKDAQDHLVEESYNPATHIKSLVGARHSKIVPLDTEINSKIHPHSFRVSKQNKSKRGLDDTLMPKNADIILQSTSDAAHRRLCPTITDLDVKEKDTPDTTPTRMPTIKQWSQVQANTEDAHSVQVQQDGKSGQKIRNSASRLSRKSILKSVVSAPNLAERHYSSASNDSNSIDHPTRGTLGENLVTNIRNSTMTRISEDAHASELYRLKGTYLLHPQGTFVVTWQLFVGGGILYSIVMTPFRLGFDQDSSGAWKYLDLCIDIFFILDIVLNFRTVYYNDDRMLVSDKMAIAERYIKGWFVLDLLSSLPFDQIVSAFTSASGKISFLPTKLLRLARIVRLLKLARLIRLSRVSGRLRDLILLSPSMERLIKLLLLMMIVCHWNACLFHGAMLLSEHAGVPNWCSDAFLPNMSINVATRCSSIIPLLDRYLAALYWAFTTLTTVGYGDVRPNLTSIYEVIFVIFSIVVNAAAFGYILSSVVVVIRNVNPAAREYKLLMKEIRDYLGDVGVSARLRANVKAHYQHTLSTTCLFPEKKLFDKMPPGLRYDVARIAAGENLFDVPLITVMEDSFRGFVSYALLLLKPLLVCQKERVCFNGDAGREMFFLVEGTCTAFDPVMQKGSLLNGHAVFEQYALIASKNESYRTLLTVTVESKRCILYSLSVQDFRSVPLHHVNATIIYC